MNILLKPDTAGATRTLVRNSKSAAARNYSTPVTATLEGRERQEQPLSRQMEEELLRERAVFEQKQQHAGEVARSEKFELKEQYIVAAAENVRLRDSLQAAEAQIAVHIEQHRMEMGQQESARLAMEQQNRGLQERVARLEEANARLAFEHRELLAQLETSRLELETHASDLTDELHRIIEMHDELVGKRRPELGARQGKT